MYPFLRYWTADAVASRELTLLNVPNGKDEPNPVLAWRKYRCLKNLAL